jgi:hypothetical protein
VTVASFHTSRPEAAAGLSEPIQASGLIAQPQTTAPRSTGLGLNERPQTRPLFTDESDRPDLSVPAVIVQEQEATQNGDYSTSRTSRSWIRNSQTDPSR